MLEHMLTWYDMTDEEREIRDLARQVAREEIAPRAAKHDAEATFVRDSIEALAEAGLLGASVPKEYGGLGGTALAATMALEAVSAACGSTGAVYLFHLNLCHMIRNAGPEHLRQKYLPQLAKDKLGAFAINERVRLFRDPFETYLTERNGDFEVSGFKPFSTSAGESDITIIQVQRPEVKVAFPVLAQEFVLVDGDSDGYSANVYDPLGLRGASNGSVKLDKVKVPKENLLGENPGGPAMISNVVVKGRSILGPNVVAAGLAGAAVEAAIRDLYERKDAPEWAHHMTAEMNTRLTSMRTYNYYGARIVPIALGGELGTDMSLAHIEPLILTAIDAPWIVDRALEVLGGKSYMSESPIQRYYRDARGCASLAFSMEHRRGAAADSLIGREIDRDYPATMTWDNVPAYSFRMSSSAALKKLPEHLRPRMARPAYEEYAREHGSDRVTLETYLDYLIGFAKQVAEGRAQAGRPPEPVGAGARGDGPPPDIGM
jgi:alkylation response protein AidB-like acyl-CoA dehydrogenase